MNRPIRIYTLGFLLTIFACIGTNVPKNAIPWRKNTLLNWSNFKTLQKAPHNGALTTAMLTFGYSCTNNKIQWNVGCWFIPDQSWVKSTMKNDYVLAHEQLHFDIAEIYARKLRQQLSEKVKTCKDASIADKLYSKTISELDLYQDRYDRETRHGMNEEQQASWSKSIQAQLAATEAWTSK